ncbi:MAG: hypothetical protein ACTS85_03405 [Arsenophonus sp. NC-PG7-MAG3]
MMMSFIVRQLTTPKINIDLKVRQVKSLRFICLTVMINTEFTVVK